MRLPLSTERLQLPPGIHKSPECVPRVVLLPNSVSAATLLVLPAALNVSRGVVVSLSSESFDEGVYPKIDDSCRNNPIGPPIASNPNPSEVNTSIVTTVLICM
ncbi:MAG: hypothetical protein ACRD5J_12045 [Nitrososphaeraceae archaeon]